ncbi:MAG TPA: class I SAM-dependent methyltransferase [Acidimicrobiales bacterium]|nr:class I SAM-dependent methyltransferase [Acidimicrobiales bacterium]
MSDTSTPNPSEAPEPEPSRDSAAWDERYRGSELLWGAGPNRFLAAETADLVPGTALDVACGEGRNSVWLAEQGWRVTGVDFSPVGLAKAAALAAERGVQVDWLEADLTRWDPPAAYDLVIVFYLQLPEDLRRAVLSRLASHVAPGGTLLVVAHDRTNLTEGFGGPQDPAVLYGPEDVAAYIGHDLRVGRAERVRRRLETPSGQIDAIDLLVRAWAPK